MTTTHPTINDILQQFFASRVAGKKGLTRRRIETVEQHLRVCLETEAERILVTRDQHPAPEPFSARGACRGSLVVPKTPPWGRSPG